MSCLLLLFLATKSTLCQQNLLSQQKALVMTQHKCYVSKNFMSQQQMSWFSKKYATHFDPTPTACGLWPASGFCCAAAVRTSWWLSIYAVSAKIWWVINKWAVRRTLTGRQTTVYRMWTLTGIWFLSAAATARTSTVVLTSSIQRSADIFSIHLVVWIFVIIK